MLKIIIGIIVGILLVIFIFQNTMAIEISFITWTITVSRAILVLIILVSGIFFGFVLTEIACIRKNIKTRKKEKQKHEKEQQEVDKKERQVKEKKEEMK